MVRDEMSTERYAKDLASDRWDNVFEHAFLGLGFALSPSRLARGPARGRRPRGELTRPRCCGQHDRPQLRVQKPPEHGVQESAARLCDGGESLYNNHHSAPTFAQLALCRHESDAARWVIRLMVRARVRTLRLTEAHFVSRSSPSTFG